MPNAVNASVNEPCGICREKPLATSFRPNANSVRCTANTQYRMSDVKSTLNNVDKNSMCRYLPRKTSNASATAIATATTFV